MTRLFIPILVLFLASCAGVNEAPKNPFAGLWKLHAMDQKDSVTGEWQPWRNGMQGYILYEGTGYMALHLTTQDYEKTDLQFPNFNDTISIEALKHLTKSYVYFANYKVDEANHVVEHHRISHSNPAEWNAVVQRRYEFSGDTLILRPVEESNSGLRLKWVKVRSE